MPIKAVGKPTQAISNSPMRAPPADSQSPFTTRFVLVPIKVRVPPRTAA
jgi:hypothetical protein